MAKSSKRILKEFTDITKELPPNIHAVTVDDSNLLCWKILITPSAPYSKGAFKVHVDFTAEYPFKPPKVNFRTPIYHPNVDEKGQVCLPIIAPENWKPAVKMDLVLKDLLTMINTPEPEHPLRADLAEEYTKDKEGFNKKAEAETVRLAEPRP
eukprot:TRINITY_DN18660_c0_g1_i1.p1 TRINITY_DN18660_c0_g1~~TRINITY_DN18660_c0_g1_i1.p1  ORF type:complete len:153 (-),score=28.70 TRINITY_DN18660_c0_g1_i1:186-644(-)